MNVHVLVTIRKPELEAVSTLVFRTIRVGFPTAHVHVWQNKCNWMPKDLEMFTIHHVATTHPTWIESLIYSEDEPFWICDGDMVFFGAVEKLSSAQPLLGRYEPDFYEPWTDTFKIRRLHTCLMRIDPEQTRKLISEYNKRYESCVLQVPSLVKQDIVPTLSKPMLYDTCCKLYHVIGGQSFTKEHNELFEHLHCGTYSDLVDKYPNIKDVHESAIKNPQSVRGLHLKQQKLYDQFKIRI